MVEVPARTLYDAARAQIARALGAGGLRILWDQFPIGKLFPLGYEPFKYVFGPGWKRYKPWSPPLEQTSLLKRPEALFRKNKALSYDYAVLKNVRSSFITSAIYLKQTQLPFKEIRYLVGSDALQQWCDFGSLQPASPNLSGASKCMDSDLGEVKSVIGIWICFAFDPMQVQPQNRFKLYGWMSAAHWNGEMWRVGEECASRRSGGPGLSTEELQLKDLSEEHKLEVLDRDFTAAAKEVEAICKPRMKMREEINRLKKIKALYAKNGSPLF